MFAKIYKLTLHLYIYVVKKYVVSHVNMFGFESFFSRVGNKLNNQYGTIDEAKGEFLRKLVLFQSVTEVKDFLEGDYNVECEVFQREAFSDIPYIFRIDPKVKDEAIFKVYELDSSMMLKKKHYITLKSKKGKIKEYK